MEHAAQRNETAEVIAEIWCEVLEIPEVGRTENFFDLGGHSVLLHLVRDRIEQRAGTAVELIDLFRYPTVASLARHLDESGSATEATAPRRSRAGAAARLADLRTRLRNDGAATREPPRSSW